MMWWICVTVAVIAVVYWKLIRPHKYWAKKGVKQGNPYFIFGDSLGTILRTQSPIDMVEMVYNMCPNTRYSGSYQFLKPTLVLKDPDLIKQITVKDFAHFLDHQGFIPEDIDPLLSINLFTTTGKRWQEMRKTVSPAFTSSKMKFMFSLISQCGEQFVKYFSNKDEDLITVEMKDIFTRFTNDTIANIAFGVECNSLEDKNNKFYLMTKEATNFTGFWKLLKFFGYVFIPNIVKHFRPRLFSDNVTNFFTKLVKTNIQSRQQHNIIRPDMIHVLLEARKIGFKHEVLEPNEDASFATVQESDFVKNQINIQHEITDENITSLAVGFFFAGFETVSSLMCFLSYELGVNLDIQERLIQEVDQTMTACNGKLTYEAVVKMKYMDMVVSESLRKWPNTVMVDRVCTKSYVIEPKNPDEKPLYLEKGTVLWLPIFGLHRDPQYYPNPLRFDPERFSDENKKDIKPYSYIPFGSGPRNCIGSRFALLETKILFCYLLSHFQIVPVGKTQIPLVISKKQINLTAEGGFWSGLKRRSKR